MMEIVMAAQVLGGDISNIPGLRQALRDAGEAALRKTFVWPTRVLLPLRRAVTPESVRPVLDADSLLALSRELFESELTASRVRTWGNPAVNRRINRNARLYQARERPNS